MNWNELTKIESTAPVKIYPAEGFFASWHKDWAHRQVRALPFISSCCALEVSGLNNVHWGLKDEAALDSWIEPGAMSLESVDKNAMKILVFSGTLTHRLTAHLQLLSANLGDNYMSLMIGGCAIGQGPFEDGYVTTSNAGDLFRVDVFVPGCPPTLEAIKHGVESLQTKLRSVEVMKEIRS